MKSEVTADFVLHVEWNPLHLQLHLAGLGELQPEGQLLPHPAAGDHDDAVPDERVVAGLEPPADLHVAEQLRVAERRRGVDHRLQ
uniref:Uncharacterized protein n=1 Tax=Oryza brachyantha TaxID=4533 RepID=J3LAL2_ORYBR